MDENGNVVQALRFFNDDGKQTCVIDLFNKFIGITVFDRQNGSQPLVKAILDLSFATSICYILEKMIADKEMQPIDLSFHIFNKTTSAKEFRCGIIIGRDATDKSIYFGINSDQHKDPVRVYLVTSNSLKINGSDMPRTIASEMGARTVTTVLKGLCGLMVASGNKAPAFKPKGDDSLPPPPPIGDDVAF